MKTIFSTIIIAICLLVSASSVVAQNVGINNTGAAPDNSALLDLNSTDKGFLITRVDTASIATPAFGLMTLAPLDSCLYMYSGANWISLGGVGNDCPCGNPTSTPPNLCGTPQTFIYKGASVTYGTVESNTVPPRCWLDRNLGANQVATSFSDAASFGDLFQWGRLDDLHQNRTSGTTSTQSTTDAPGHGNYITVNGAPNDWRNPQNSNLWQGVAGINNPCPPGFRLPTNAEYEAERLSWPSNDNVGAFASPLKLTATGARSRTGGLSSVGSIGHYWSSTVNGTESKYLGFYGSGASMFSDPHGFGFAVRCIKD